MSKRFKSPEHRPVRQSVNNNLKQSRSSLYYTGRPNTVDFRNAISDPMKTVEHSLTSSNILTRSKSDLFLTGPSKTVSIAANIPIRSNFTVSTAGSDNTNVSLTRSDSTLLSRSDSTSISLASSPAHKRSRLSTRKGNHSPGTASTTNESSQSPTYNPITSPFRRGATCQQLAGNSMLSPLSTRTIYKSMRTPPSRNWLCSQEPHRDIQWDNTSPVNTKRILGDMKNLANLQELRSVLGTHDGEVCASQNSGLSDKWLSNAATDARFTRIKHVTDESPKNTGKKLSRCKSPLVRHPSKELHLLMNKIRHPIQTDQVKLCESTSEDSADDAVLVPGTNATFDLHNSSEDLWGDEDVFSEIADSELIKATSVLSTLSYENVGVGLSRNQVPSIQDDCEVVFQSQSSNAAVVTRSQENAGTDSIKQPMNKPSAIPSVNVMNKAAKRFTQEDCGYQIGCEINNLEEHSLTKIKSTRECIGMPGAWLSQDLSFKDSKFNQPKENLSTSAAISSKVPNFKFKPIMSQEKCSNGAATSSKTPNYQPKLVSAPSSGEARERLLRSQNEMPRCVKIESQDDDDEIFSQADLKHLDLIVEQHSSQSRGSETHGSFGNSSQIKQSQPLNQMNSSSQPDSSERRPCSREEINRKRAEALRLRQKKLNITNQNNNNAVPRRDSLRSKSAL